MNQARKQSKQTARFAGFFLGLFTLFILEDTEDVFIRNVGLCPNYHGVTTQNVEFYCF
jgi:hypothetical protein